MNSPKLPLRGTNSQTVERWLSARGDSDRFMNKTGSLFSVGRWLFSYGKHFPLAYRDPSGRILVTKERFSLPWGRASVTTSRHKTLVLRSGLDADLFDLRPLSEMMALANAGEVA